jgi:hypothetical protein
MRESDRPQPSRARLRTRSPFGTGIAFLGAGIAFTVSGIAESNRLAIMGATLIVVSIIFLATGIIPPRAEVKARSQDDRNQQHPLPPRQLPPQP